MVRLKIISNPYQKKISFQKWNQNEWITIENRTDESSHLLNEKITKGFFPFKAQEILKTIIGEYAGNYEEIELVFEGTEDEYHGLKILCEDDAYKSDVKLMKLETKLQNAEKVFAGIKRLFSDKLSMILKNTDISEEMKNELDKYKDASNDVIPICVIGNYSTGKSTFINALIGNEILTSDVKTSTAWNYKIMNSSKDHCAEIHFCCEGLLIDLIFEEKGWSATHEDSAIVQEIKTKIEQIDTEDVILRVRTALSVINRCMKDLNLDISDIIEVKVPFRNSVLMKEHKQFIIFDTPGSNSASNQNHTQVLKDALKGLSNGILLFVTGYDHLDGNDNEALYQSIEKMKEFDNRFTMIIVNRIDMQNGLPLNGFSEDEIQEIMEEAIPRNLYSAGIYFVSSVMGLGAKNEGKFFDRALQDAYCKIKKIDSDEELYRKYYRYNIVPKQLEKEEQTAAELCENVLLADSGLFSVENRIKKFAENYSVYNKCIQSQTFLKNVISEMSEMIQRKRNMLEESSRIAKEHLEKKKELLLNKIEETSRTLEKQYYDNYNDSKVRKEYIEQCKVNFSDFLDEIFEESKKKSEFTKLVQKQSDLPILRGLTKHISDIANEVGFWMTPTEKRQLIDQSNQAYKNDAKKIQEQLNKESRQYWGRKTEVIKEELVKIIIGSEAVTDENKTILKDIIMSYEKTEFEDYSEEVFTNEFMAQRSPDLLKKQLKENYDTELEKSLEPICRKIKNSHAESFNKWSDELQHAIDQNIEIYSPELQKLAKQVEEEDKKIEKIKERQKEIEKCADNVEKMMEWITEE